jgi:molybdate transport system substrate-binding protein
VVATAPEGSHKPVNYPAAVLKASKNQDAAQAFLAYLKTDEAAKVFTDIGFAVPER